MANNFFISYDLNKETDSSVYETLADKIESLGQATPIQKSLWFLSTDSELQYVYDSLGCEIDENDYLIVIDAINACWGNLIPGASDFVLGNWTYRS